MTATVIPFPSKSVREAVLEAPKDAEVVRRYTKRPRMDGDTLTCNLSLVKSDREGL